MSQELKNYTAKITIQAQNEQEANNVFKSLATIAQVLENHEITTIGEFLEVEENQNMLIKVIGMIQGNIENPALKAIAMPLFSFFGINPQDFKTQKGD